MAKISPVYNDIFSKDDVDFFSTSVYVFSRTKGYNNIIFGKNAKYGNITSFGGYREEGETLLETTVREFMEETLGVLCSEDKIREHLLNYSYVLKKITPKGICYNSFVFIDVNFRECVEKFETKLKEEWDTLPKEMKENSTLVAVDIGLPLHKARAATDINNIIIPDINGREHKLRSICQDTLGYVFVYYMGMIDRIFLKKESFKKIDK